MAESRNKMDDLLIQEIELKISEIGEKYLFKKLTKYEKITLDSWEDDEYYYHECLVYPCKWIRSFKIEVEKYLRTIMICEIIEVKISDPTNNNIYLFTATNREYDEQEWFNSQTFTKQFKIKKKVGTK